MADPPRYEETRDDPGVGPDGASSTGTPRWVKVFGIVALVVVVLVVILLVTGRGGEHGPGRHSSGSGTHASPSSITEHAGQQR